MSCFLLQTPYDSQHIYKIADMCDIFPVNPINPRNGEQIKSSHRRYHIL